jgi:hypothetical protein
MSNGARLPMIGEAAPIDVAATGLASCSITDTEWCVMLE